MQHPSLYAEIKCQSRRCAAPLWHSKKSVGKKNPTHINMQWMRREWFDCFCHLKCSTTASKGAHWKRMGEAASLLRCHIWCAPSLRMCAKSTHITATFSTTATLLLLQGLWTNSSPQMKFNNSVMEWQGAREHKVHPVEVCSFLKCWFIAYKMSEVCHHPSTLTVCHVQRLDCGSQDIKPAISAAYHILKQILNKYTLKYKV